MNIYIVAICGKGSGNLAVFLKKQGHQVRGSEFSRETFYPPISQILLENDIKVDFGFDPDCITSNIDLVIIGGAAFIHDRNNPQVAKAYELGLKVITVAHAIGEFVSKKNHISVVGNHGKTTTTGLIAKTFREANLDISFFIGEATLDFENSIYSGSSEWSVAEGDEHPTIGFDMRGKFMYHKPKHVVFTSAEWDHRNIFKTEKAYLDVFIDLFKSLPDDGKVIACINASNVLNVLNQAKPNNEIVFYTIGKFNDAFDTVSENEVEEYVKNMLKRYRVRYPSVMTKAQALYYACEVDYKWKTDSTRFLVRCLDLKTLKKENVGYFETKLIGQIGLENSLSSITTALTFGIPVQAIKSSLVSYKGAKRRLEVVYNHGYIVIDDYAHSPIKIKQSLKSVRTKFFDKKIFVIFQVGQSGLKEKRTFYQLKYAFNLANFVIVTKVTPNVDASVKFFGKDYCDLIRAGAASSETSFLSPNNVFYAPLEVQIKSILESNLKQGDIVLIMSSTNNKNIVDLVKGLSYNLN